MSSSATAGGMAASGNAELAQQLAADIAAEAAHLDQTIGGFLLGPRAEKVEQLRAEYAAEIDVLHLASELVVDAVIQPEHLRSDLVKRYRLYQTASREWPAKHNPVTPV